MANYIHISNGSDGHNNQSAWIAFWGVIIAALIGAAAVILAAIMSTKSEAPKPSELNPPPQQRQYLQISLSRPSPPLFPDLLSITYGSDQDN
jgi:hypothetical protein